MQRTSLVTFASAFLLLVLPACGDKDDSEASTTDPTTSADEESTSADEESTSATDAEDTDDGVDTTDTTDSVDTTDTTDDGGFVNMDTPGSSCGDECDIWNPDDCPDGEKCTAVGCAVGINTWDSNVCREVMGSGAVGDECMTTDGSALSGNDTCEKGSMCWNPDLDTGIGACVAFCTGSADAPSCAAGTSCANWSTLPLCLPNCDPLAQDCELASDLCVQNPSGDGYACVLDASGDMGPYGTPCEYVNVCNEGLLCIGSEGVPEPECTSASGCCSPICAISAGDPCPGQGQTCEPVFDPQPPGYEDVGVCSIAV